CSTSIRSDSRRLGDSPLILLSRDYLDEACRRRPVSHVVPRFSRLCHKRADLIRVLSTIRLDTARDIDGGWLHMLSGIRYVIRVETARQYDRVVASQFG